MVYRLEYRGVYLGRYQLSAKKEAGGGWRFEGKIVGFSPARVLGFDLKLRSQTTPRLTTLRFEKTIQSPTQGTLRLVAVVGQEVRAIRYQNGRVQGRYRARARNVRDDLSLVYHIRVRPEAQNVAFLGLYGIVRGPLTAGRPRELQVPAGRFRVRSFRFDQRAAYFQVDLSEPERLPVRIVFGYGDERIVALLLKKP